MENDCARLKAGEDGEGEVHVDEGHEHADMDVGEEVLVGEQMPLACKSVCLAAATWAWVVNTSC